MCVLCACVQVSVSIIELCKGQWSPMVTNVMVLFLSSSYYYCVDIPGANRCTTTYLDFIFMKVYLLGRG